MINRNPVKKILAGFFKKKYLIASLLSDYY